MGFLLAWNYNFSTNVLQGLIYVREAIQLENVHLVFIEIHTYRIFIVFSLQAMKRISTVFNMFFFQNINKDWGDLLLALLPIHGKKSESEYGKT